MPLVREACSAHPRCGSAGLECGGSPTSPGLAAAAFVGRPPTPRIREQSSQTARRKQSFRTPKVAGPRYNFRAVTLMEEFENRGFLDHLLETPQGRRSGFNSRRPCQGETASGNTRLRPSILTLPPEYLRLSPF